MKNYKIAVMFGIVLAISCLLALMGLIHSSGASTEVYLTLIGVWLLGMGISFTAEYMKNKRKGD